MTVVVKVGDNVRYWRMVRAMTQIELSEKADVSHAALVRIEKNQSDPHVSTIRKLSEALDISPELLLPPRSSSFWTSDE